MSAPNKKKNLIELEENLLDQEHYISPEQQKYYDDIFEEPENITQSNGTKSTHSNQSTNKKCKKKRKRRRRNIFQKVNLAHESVDAITERNKSIKGEEPNKNAEKLTGKKMKRKTEQKKGKNEKEKSSIINYVNIENGFNQVEPEILKFNQNIDADTSVLKVGEGLDIFGPKRESILFDINLTKKGEGAEIPEPKIGVPNVDAYINSPEISGGLDTKVPNIGLSNVGIVTDMPKIGEGLNYHGPESQSQFSVIKGPDIGLSNVDVVTNATKIGGEFDILVPKNKGPFLVIKRTEIELSNVGTHINKQKIDSGLNNHMPKNKGLFLVTKGPKIRLSNVDPNFDAPKIGIGLNIHGPKKRGPFLVITVPEINGGLGNTESMIGLPNEDMNRNTPKNEEDINDSFFNSLAINKELFDDPNKKDLYENCDDDDRLDPEQFDVSKICSNKRNFNLIQGYWQNNNQDSTNYSSA